jgi:hypothetical protein
MTSTTILENTANGASQRPEFIRLPQPGKRCPYTGLSRSGLNNLVLPCDLNGFKPPVRSVCLRQRGAVRGTRLICYDSLIGYLRHQGASDTAA